MSTSPIYAYSSVDKELIVIPDVVAKRSPAISDMLENCSLEENKKEGIPDEEKALINVAYRKSTLALLFEVAMIAHTTKVSDEKKGTTQSGAPKDIFDEALAQRVTAIYPAAHDLLSKYDYKETIEELYIASSYFQDMECVNVIAKEIASRIEGKSREEIREFFGIVNDFTPEEEEEIMKNCRIVNFDKNEDK